MGTMIELFQDPPGDSTCRPDPVKESSKTRS